MLHKSFKPAKCKTSLKMAVSRIKLLKNKRDAQVKHLKRELAQLLESGQDQTARIRVEHVVREEKTMAAYDLVEIYCELIAARLPIIESQKNCPIDLKEAIASVIFASPRCADIPELMDVRKHLTAKYGKEFVTAALELRPDCGVSRLLVEKLSAKAPDGPTKVKILHTIAAEHNVKWEPKSFEERELKPHEDLLNGPNSFEKSSKSYLDPPKSQPSSSHDETRAQLQTYGEQGPPSGQVPPQPMEKINMPENFNNHSPRLSSSSPNFDHSNVWDSKHGLSVAYHPGSGAGGMKHEDTYSLDGSSSGSRKNWTMEFKDATAAAQAAAESAERASMAARAAAQLSSRGSSTMQYSAESSKAPQVPTYVKQNYSSSTLQSPPVAGDSAEHSRPENITRQYSVESHESSVDIPRDEPQNYASPTMHSHVTGKSENLSYNQRKPRMTHGQIGSFEHNHSDEDENLASVDYKSSSLTQVKPVPASFTSRLSFGNLQTPDAYSPQNTSEANGDLGYTSIDRKKSDKFEIPFTREPPDIRNSENVDYHEFDDQEQSSRDVSYSHTYAYSDDRDIFSNVTQHPGKSYDEDTFVASDRESSQRYTDETKLHANASAVFDDYGSDNDENIIDWENNHMKQVYSDVDNFPSSVDRSSNSPFRGVNSQTRQDVEATRASMEESDVFTEEKYAQIFTKSSTRSGHDSQADELPVTFDDSNSHDSESEEELRKSKLMNVGDGSVSRDQRAASHEVKADFVLAESAEIVEDVVSSKTPSLVSGSELNFGTLTGGLRNKGYRNPPYSKVPADSGLAKETSTKMENVVEPSVSAVSHTEKVYGRQEIQGTKYDLSTSEDDFEDELQKYTSTSSRDGYSKYNKASTKVPGPSLNSVYTDEEDFHQKPLEQKTRPNTGFSRRTKPLPSYLKQRSKNTSTVSPEQHVVVFDPVDNSSSLSHGVEALGKREVQGNRTEIRRSSQEPVVTSHTTSRSASESKRSSIDETSWLSERKPSSSKAEPQEQSSDHRSGFMLPKVSEKGTNKQVLETNNAGLGGKSISSTKMVSPMGNQSSKGSGREASSRDQPTHVHPNLPDYDTLAARLQSLRQNRQ